MGKGRLCEAESVGFELPGFVLEPDSITKLNHACVAADSRGRQGLGLSFSFKERNRFLYFPLLQKIKPTCI